MATFELYRRSTIGMCLTETLDEMVSSGTLSPELAIQVLVQFDKVWHRWITFYGHSSVFASEQGSNFVTLRVILIYVLSVFLLQSMTEALENQVKSKVTVKVLRSLNEAAIVRASSSVFACLVGS